MVILFSGVWIPVRISSSFRFLRKEIGVYRLVNDKGFCKHVTNCLCVGIGTSDLAFHISVTVYKEIVSLTYRLWCVIYALLCYGFGFQFFLEASQHCQFVEPLRVLGERSTRVIASSTPMRSPLYLVVTYLRTALL